MAPNKRTMTASFAKMPTTPVLDLAVEALDPLVECCFGPLVEQTGEARRS
jgi:hypothetical protein